MATFELDQFELEEYLVQIITGKKIFFHNDEVFAVTFPDIKVRDSSRLVYLKTAKKLQAKHLPTRDEMKSIIRENNLLTPQYYQRITQLQAEIESLDKARELTTSKSQKADLDFQIEKQQRELLKLKMQEYNYMVNTVESKAEEAQLDYLVSACTLTGQELDVRVWNSYADFQKCNNSTFILEAKSNLMALQSGIAPVVLRAIARSGEWRRRWKAAKQTGSQIFEGSSADWDRNKVEICYWSDFYDGIYSYHTPPPEDIINDDDALFDWIREVNRLNKMEASGGATASEPGVIKKRVNTPYKVRPKTD